MHSHKHFEKRHDLFNLWEIAILFDLTSDSGPEQGLELRLVVHDIDNVLFEGGQELCLQALEVLLRMRANLRVGPPADVARNPSELVAPVEASALQKELVLLLGPVCLRCRHPLRSYSGRFAKKRS